jgi:hypothetical protein
MKLLSFDLSDHYSNLNSLLTTLNQFVETQKYDVIKKKTKKFVKEVLRKAVLRCDKDRNSKTQKFERREISIRLSECSFDAVVTLKDEE